MLLHKEKVTDVVFEPESHVVTQVRKRVRLFLDGNMNMMQVLDTHVIAHVRRTYNRYLIAAVKAAGKSIGAPRWRTM